MASPAPTKLGHRRRLAANHKRGDPAGCQPRSRLQCQRPGPWVPAGPRRHVRLDFPGARSSQAFDINDRGQVVGLSISGPNAETLSGFLRDARGRVTAINRPAGAAGATGTALLGIAHPRYRGSVAPGRQCGRLPSRDRYERTRVG